MVQNPYAAVGRKSGRGGGSGVSSTYLWLILTCLFLVLTSRGYHRRKEKALRRKNRNVTGNMIHNTTVANGPSSSSWWDPVNYVADNLGAAAESAGDWMHEPAEEWFGGDFVHGVGNVLDKGLDFAGDWPDWSNDDDDDDDDEDDDNEDNDGEDKDKDKDKDNNTSQDKRMPNENEAPPPPTTQEPKKTLEYVQLEKKKPQEQPSAAAAAAKPAKDEESSTRNEAAAAAAAAQPPKPAVATTATATA